MLDYGFDNFRMERALEPGQEAARVTVLGGDQASIRAVAAESLSGAVEIGKKVTVEVDTSPLTAPVRAGQVVGAARLVCNGQTVDSCELVADGAVQVWSLAAAIRSVLRNWALQFA